MACFSKLILGKSFEHEKLRRVELKETLELRDRVKIPDSNRVVFNGIRADFKNVKVIIFFVWWRLQLERRFRSEVPGEMED